MKVDHQTEESKVSFIINDINYGRVPEIITLDTSLNYRLAIALFIPNDGAQVHLI